MATATSYADRYLVGLVVEPIKRDFQLSDATASLLQGLAFSAAFVAAGVPLGRLVDRYRRMPLVAAGIAVWSIMTMTCGLVVGFPALLACRMLVAAGEATLTPAAFSILIDVVPRRRLGLANGILISGVYLGAGLAFFAGAAVLSHLTKSGGIALPIVGPIRPWQGLFVFFGMLGLPEAFWAACLREPERSGQSVEVATVPFGDIATFARSHAATLACLFLSAGFAALCAQAYAAWLPSPLIRSFGWNIARAATSTGLVIIIGGVLGVVTAGLVGDALLARNYRLGRVAAMIVSGVCALPFAVGAPLAGEPRLTLLLATLSTSFTTILLASVPPAIQEVLPNRMRGTISAIYVLVVNFVGLGLGPTAVALVTDYGLRDEHRIGVALAGVSFFAMTIAMTAATLALAPYRISAALERRTIEA